jgi:ribose transport system permease protein
MSQGVGSRRNPFRGIDRYTLIFVWILLIAVFTWTEPGQFLTSANLSSMFSSQSVLMVLTLSLMLTLTAGEYDLSAASVLTLSSMTVAVLNVNQHWPIGLAIVAALVVGVLVGLVNAFFVVMVGIESFIVTLGTGTVAMGVVLWISNENTITGVANWLVSAVIVPKLWGLSFGFLYCLVGTFVFWYLMDYTPLGRRFLFVGRGRNVARLAGLHVPRLRASAFVIGGFVAAFAGVMYTGTAGAADPTSGASLLLPAFAAAYLGSTTIQPGRFNAIGSFIAVYFLVTGITGVSILGAAVFVQNLFYGGALVVAVSASTVLRRRAARLERALTVGPGDASPSEAGNQIASDAEGEVSRG